MTSYPGVLRAIGVTISESSDCEAKYIVETEEESRGEEDHGRDPSRQVAVSICMRNGQVTFKLRHEWVEN